MNQIPKKKEKTVLILKPEALKKRRTGACLAALEEYGFVVTEAFSVELTADVIYKFYELLSEYPDPEVVSSFTGGQSLVISLEIAKSIDGLIGLYRIEKNFPAKLASIHDDDIVKFWFG